MKYLSFFSGIGGFEIAIESKHKQKNTCIGFSEIDKKALEVYQQHFPDHPPLGDIAKITNTRISAIVKNGCDLIVGGFPCQNLTSYGYTMNVGNGLEGAKSGLFYELLRIIKITLKHNPDLHIVLENNASMKHSERNKITNELQKVLKKRQVHITTINAGDMGVQTRRRLFWTTFPVDQPKKRIQSWKDVLDPIDEVRKNGKFASEENVAYLNSHCSLNKSYKKAMILAVPVSGLGLNSQRARAYRFKDHTEATRWYLQVSNTIDKNAKPVVRIHSFLNDYRGEKPGVFVPRYYSPKELCRLFGFPTKFAKGLSYNQAQLLFGNCVVVHVVKHVLSFCT